MPKKLTLIGCLNEVAWKSVFCGVLLFIYWNRGLLIDITACIKAFLDSFKEWNW